MIRTSQINVFILHVGHEKSLEFSIDNSNIVSEQSIIRKVLQFFTTISRANRTVISMYSPLDE